MGSHYCLFSACIHSHWVNDPVTVNTCGLHDDHNAMKTVISSSVENSRCPNTPRCKLPNILYPD